MRNMKPLILANSIHGFEIHAQDGMSGRIDDFYFNDRTWNIFNVAVDLGNWLTGRKVAILPEALGVADWRKKHIEAKMTRKQVDESPDAEALMPSGLQIDRRFNLSLMNDTMIPEAFLGMPQYLEFAKPAVSEKTDPHLQSAMELKDCAVVSGEGKHIGRIVDLLIDTETWEILFLLLKTNDSRVFLAQPEIVQSIDTVGRTVTVTPPGEIKNDWQEYDPHYMALMEIGES